jgi:dienelactone hydrolase
MRFLIFCTVLACLANTSFAQKDFAAMQEKVLSLEELTTAPKVHPAEGFVEEDGIRPIYFEALPWRGKPTRVFAWLGIPQTDSTEDSASRKFPAIVLVHGGGGTAFKEWVKKWNDKGFVAISIAVEGQTDKRKQDGQGWQSHAWPGPAREGIYGDTDQPLEEQWMYHAVADTVLANSLLRSLPEVKPDQVGLMGISWGGVITSTVIGIDQRFAFGIPTYGCGDLADSENQYGHALGKNQVYRQVWDPMVRMKRAKLPTLWLSWTGDQHFPLDALRNCYEAASGPHMIALVPNMRHGHGASWNPPDSYVFAESIVNGNTPWCVQKDKQLTNEQFAVSFQSKRKIDKANLVFTTDSGFTGDRKWQELPAKLSQEADVVNVKATVPENATSWFFNLHSGNVVASSDYEEMRP